MKFKLRKKIGNCKYSYHYHSLSDDPFRHGVSYDLCQYLDMSQIDTERIYLFYFLNKSVPYDLQDAATGTGYGVTVYKELIRFLNESMPQSDYDIFIYYCDEERVSLYDKVFGYKLKDHLDGYELYRYKLDDGDILNIYLRKNILWSID